MIAMYPRWMAILILLSVATDPVCVAQSSAYQQAKQQYEKEEYLAAMTTASRAKREGEFDPHFQRLYGLILTALGQFTEAEEHLRKALKLRPNEAEFHYAVGAFLIQQKMAATDQLPSHLADDLTTGTEAEMVSRLERAVELDPDFLKARLHLGRTYYEQNRVDAAMEQFQALIQRDPKYPWGHYHIGLIHHNVGAAEDAIREFRTELELYPDHTESRVDLGTLLLQRGQAEEALSHLLRARSEQPQSVEVQSGLAKAYRDLGKFEEAVSEARKLIDLSPQLPDGYYILSQLYQQSGKTELARQALARFQKAWRAERAASGGSRRSSRR